MYIARKIVRVAAKAKFLRIISASGSGSGSGLVTAPSSPPRQSVYGNTVTDDWHLHRYGRMSSPTSSTSSSTDAIGSAIDTPDTPLLDARVTSVIPVGTVTTLKNGSDTNTAPDTGIGEDTSSSDFARRTLYDDSSI